MARRSYLAVLASAVLCYAALGAVLRLLPVVVDDRAVLGLLVGAPAITAVVARPLGGRLADRLGPACVLAAGGLLMAAGIAPALAGNDTALLLASRLATGAGEGLMMSAAVLWLLRLAGPDRLGAALGHIGLANYAGLTIGPLLAGAVGVRTAAILAAAGALPLAAIALSRLAAVPAVPPGRAEGATPARAVMAPGVALSCVNIGYVALLGFGPAVTGTALVVPLFAAGVIAVRTLGGELPARLGARRTATCSSLVAAAGLALVAGAVAVPGTLALAVGQGLAVPALGLLALAPVPRARQGAAAGLFFAFFDGGVGAGGPLTGAMARLTTPAGALWLAAAAVALAAVIRARSQRGRRHDFPLLQ